MGKLLGRIFKEDFKSVILWMGLPLVFALVVSQLIKFYGQNPLVMVLFSLTMTLAMAGPFIALIYVAVADYERFYGKYAAFYSALPVKTGSISWARFLNYVLMTLVAIVISFLNFIIFASILSEGPIVFSEVLESIRTILSTVDIKNIIGAIVYVLALTIVNILLIQFSITAGSSGILGKQSKIKVIIVYVVASLIVGLIFARIQVGSSIRYESLEYTNQTATQVEVITDNSNGYTALLAPIGFNVISSVLLAAGTYYLHDRKLSVA